jgi:uncharacterized protein YndB with AHSA1/START domain
MHMSTGITVLKIHLKASRSKVYSTLLDGSLVCKWKVPTEMTCYVHEFNAYEGGTIRISLSYNDVNETGKTILNTDTYHGHFIRLVPNEEIVETDEFETTDQTVRGLMTITYTLDDVNGGTDLTIVHEGLPSGVAVSDNEIGWRMALVKFASLVQEVT